MPSPPTCTRRMSQDSWLLKKYLVFRLRVLDKKWFSLCSSDLYARTGQDPEKECCRSVCTNPKPLSLCALLLSLWSFFCSLRQLFVCRLGRRKTKKAIKLRSSLVASWNFRIVALCASSPFIETGGTKQYIPTTAFSSGSGDSSAALSSSSCASAGGE